MLKDKVDGYLHPHVTLNPPLLMTWEHEFRSGSMEAEVKDSHFERYTSTFWFGQSQPYQDVDKQYSEYLKLGYNEKKFREVYKNRYNIGMWITCFLAYNPKSLLVQKFMDTWYYQTLRHTTQDQIGFPFTCWYHDIIPYTFPDENIKGLGHSQTDFYIKHNHGK